MTDSAKQPVFASAKNAITGTTALAIADAIIDFALERIEDAISDYGGIDAVIDAAHKLYDEKIVPLDVPYVPASVEAMLDIGAKELLAQAIRAGYEALPKAS